MQNSSNSPSLLASLFPELAKRQQIEIKARERLPNGKGGQVRQRFVNSVSSALATAAAFDKEGLDAYFGVAVRKPTFTTDGDGNQHQVGTKDSFLYTNAIWLDIDFRPAATTPSAAGEQAPAEEMMRQANRALNAMLLTPSYVIDSGSGLHVYWLLSSPCEDGDRAEALMKRLCRQMKTDPTWDRIHVLRVPDTHNHKYTSHPVVSEIHVAPHLRYEMADLEVMSKTSAAIVRKIKQGPAADDDRSALDWHVISSLLAAGATDGMIEHLYAQFPIGEKAQERGPRYLQRTIERARAEVEATSGSGLTSVTLAGAQQDTDDAAPPKAKRGRPRKPKPDASSDSGDDSFSDDAETPEPDMEANNLTAFYPSLMLAEGPDGTYAVDRKGNALRFTTFVLGVEGVIAADDSLEGGGTSFDDISLTISANGMVWRHVVLPASVFNDERSLRNNLYRLAWNFSGTSRQASLLKELILLKWNELGRPRRLGLRALGRQVVNYGKATYDVFVTSDGVYDSVTGMRHDEFIYLPSPLESLPTVKLNFGVELPPDTLQTLVNHLFKVHTPSVTVPLLGWWIAAHYRPMLAACDIHFPLLLLHGTRGSGKSTLLRIFQRLQGVGVQSGDQLSSGTTPFVISRMLGATTSIPVRLAEYRAGTLRDPFRFGQIMRLSYDNGVDSRGHADQSTTVFHYTAPVCIDGEEPFTDPALRERAIMLYLSTDLLETNPDFRAAKDALNALPLQDFGAILLQHLSTYDPLELYRESVEIIHQTLPHMSSRVENNYAVMLLGLVALARFCRDYDLDMPIPLTPAALRPLLTPSLVQDVDIESGFSRLSADSFVEAVINQIATAMSDPNQLVRLPIHFRLDPKTESIVGFNLRTAYDWWVQQIARGNTHSQIVEHNAIRNQLQHERAKTEGAPNKVGAYFLGAKQAMCTNTKTVSRLFFIDLKDCVAAGLDVPESLSAKGEFGMQVTTGPDGTTKSIKLGFS